MYSPIELDTETKHGTFGHAHLGHKKCIPFHVIDAAFIALFSSNKLHDCEVNPMQKCQKLQPLEQPLEQPLATEQVSISPHCYDPSLSAHHEAGDWFLQVLAVREWPSTRL